MLRIKEERVLKVLVGFSLDSGKGKNLDLGLTLALLETTYFVPYSPFTYVIVNWEQLN